MSGPKVVRVRWVTLESAAALDELAAVLDEWSACMRRHGALSREKFDHAKSRFNELQRLHDARRWQKVRTDARRESQALCREMRGRTEAVRRAEATRERRRRVYGAACTIANALTADRQTGPGWSTRCPFPGVGGNGGRDRVARRVVDRAVDAVRPAASPTATAEQLQLAQRLASDAEEWKATVTPRDPSTGTGTERVDLTGFSRRSKRWTTRRSLARSCLAPPQLTRNRRRGSGSS